MNFKAFQKALREESSAVLSTEIPADLLTPTSVFCALTRGRSKPAFLFESVEGGESVGRYSVIGIDPIAELRLYADGGVLKTGSRRIRFTHDEFPVVIRERLAPKTHRPDTAREGGMFGGWVGYIGYDCVRLFERLPVSGRDVLGHPWACLGLYDSVVTFDHVRQTARASVTVVDSACDSRAARTAYDQSRHKLENMVRRLERPSAPVPPMDLRTRSASSNMTRKAFADGVRQVKRHIGRGDIFQAVLSQRFTRKGPVDPLTAYRRLRRSNPSPYMYFLQLDDMSVVGSSPETLVQLQDGVVTTRPIAGTRPRGRDRTEDLKLERQLLSSPKENAEHVMLVDLGRNDLGRVSRAGTVRTEQFAEVDRYSHVMHIVSRVTGRIRNGVDAYDVLAATFPAGTVSGAPKIRAMEIIDAIEPDQRGVYAGCVGYIDWWGDLDTAIAIRTAVMDKRGAYVQAGAGIVADSDPDREFLETCNKAAAPLTAVGGSLEGLR